MKKLLAALLALAALTALTDNVKAQTDVVERRLFDKFAVPAPKEAAVEKVLSAMGPDGRFDDIDYTDEGFNTGDKKRQHLARIALLSKAYVAESGAYSGNRAVYDAIERGADFWITAALEDQNWWQRIIGFPKDFMASLVLMRPTLEKSNPELLKRWYDYELYSWSLPEQRAQKGANGTDICKFTFATAVLTRNEALLKEVMEKVGSLICVVDGPKDEGVQPDWSFSQHTGSGRQLYLGTYGQEYLDGALYFMELTAGTPYALPAEKSAIIENLLVDGVAWSWYKGEFDPNQCGRKITGSNYSASTFVSQMRRMIALRTPQQSRLEESLRMMEGQTELTGNKAYPRHDFMIHRGKGYYSSFRMTSTRTVGNEAGNGQGFDNYHTGDGAAYVKVKGDEYSPIYEVWNWRLIPGTTTAVDDKPMPRPMWGRGGGGGSDFAGVLSDGTEGVAGFIYNKDGVTARKSWFCFEDLHVALGAGITSDRTDAPVITVINQTSLRTPIEEGSDISNLWHYGIGYRFLSPAKAERVQTKKDDILLLTINHGAAPQNASYAYAVYPAVERKAFGKSRAEFKIIANTPEVQAVEYKGTVMAVFYSAGAIKVSGYRISADGPATVICRPKRNILLSASPFADSRPDYTPNVKLNK